MKSTPLSQLSRGTLPLRSAAQAAALVMACAALAWLYSEPSGIAPGIRIGGSELSGLATFGAVKKAVKEMYDPNRRMTVRLGERAVQATPAQIGVTVDTDRTAARAWIDGRQSSLAARAGSHWRARRGETLEIAPSVADMDEARLGRFLKSLSVANDRREMRAVERGGKWFLPDTTPPSKVDPVTGLHALKTAILAGKQEVDLPLRLSTPSVSSTATTSSPFSSPSSSSSSAPFGLRAAASARQDFRTKAPQACHNIRIAARMLDGIVVPPGEKFQFNAAVGARTTDRGFRNAPAFKGSKVVDDVGGGVCGLSSLVYQAALRSGLPIVERHNHTFRTSAFPLDAMVDYPSRRDFSFMNNTAAPLVISAKMQGARCAVSIWTTETPPGISSVKVETDKIAAGPGRLRVVTWRSLRLADGSTRREKISEGIYRLEHPGHAPRSRKARR
jgi:vancomycin resistance protein YoaR